MKTNYKYITKQVEPENQTSPLDYFGFNVWEDIFIAGNTHYAKLTDDNFEHIVNRFDEIGMYANVKNNKMVITDFYDDLNDMLSDLFPCEKGYYNNEEIEKWESLIISYWKNENLSNDIICEALTIITNKQYNWKCLKGCSQGEWNYIYYPTEIYSEKDIEDFEYEYFNTGTEWIVTECEDGEETSYYTHTCSNDESRIELAQWLECNPDDIQMFEFIGYEQIPKYNEV